jgi:hypothetical protein
MLVVIGSARETCLRRLLRNCHRRGTRLLCCANQSACGATDWQGRVHPGLTLQSKALLAKWAPRQDVQSVPIDGEAAVADYGLRAGAIENWTEGTTVCVRQVEPFVGRDFVLAGNVRVGI